MENELDQSINESVIKMGEQIGLNNDVWYNQLLILGLIIAISVIMYIIANKVGDSVIKNVLSKNKNFSERKVKTLQSLVINIYHAITTFILIVIILGILGIETTSIIAVFSVFSLAIGLAAQDVIKDFISGFLLVLEDQFSVGDTIVINNDVQGVVENLGLRTSSLRTLDGELYIIPNGHIETIKTFSKEFSRAVVLVGVDYSTNIDKCLEILNNEMEIAEKDLEYVMVIPEVQGVVELADSAVNIRIVAQCQIDRKWDVERELLRRIKNRLDKENISIPFPQRVIHTVKED